MFRPFEALDYGPDVRLRTFENFVRERLAGRRLLTPDEAHALLDGRPARLTDLCRRQTAGLLLLFGYRDRGDGSYERMTPWPEERGDRRFAARAPVRA